MVDSSKTRFAIITVTSGIIILLLFSLLAFTTSVKDNEVVTVKRLNIVDENGKPVLVLSNKDLIPDPVLGGKTFKRAVDGAGMILYQENGDETGGIAMSQTDETGLRAMVLDYNNTDAIALLVREDHNKSGNYSAGLMINNIRNPARASLETCLLQAALCGG